MDQRGRQEGSLRSTDDQARLARVEGQLAVLQAEVAQLKRRLTWAGEAGDELGNDRLSPAFSEVALTFFVAIDPRPPQTAVLDPSGSVFVPPSRAVTATPVVVVHAPPELRDWARTRPASLARHADSLLAGVKERLSEVAAEQIVDVVWNQMNWQVTDFGGFAGAADLLGHLDSMAHRAVGAWLAELGRALGVPGPIASCAGMVIGCLVPLPIDRPLEIASLAIAITGVAVFTIVGGKVMVCASFKELVHKALTDLLAKELRSVLSPAQPHDLPGLPATRDRQPPPHPATPAPAQTDKPAAPGRGRIHPAAPAPAQTDKPAAPGRGRIHPAAPAPAQTDKPAAPGRGPTGESAAPAPAPTRGPASPLQP